MLDTLNYLSILECAHTLPTGRYIVVTIFLNPTHQRVCGIAKHKETGSLVILEDEKNNYDAFSSISPDEEFYVDEKGKVYEDDMLDKWERDTHGRQLEKESFEEEEERKEKLKQAV